MMKKVCNKCGKVIEGYHDKHVNYLMDQHTLSKHSKKEKVKEEKGKEKKENGWNKKRIFGKSKNFEKLW